jgi:hypothetical protein
MEIKSVRLPIEEGFNKKLVKKELNINTVAEILMVYLE